jgi:hypothetical protein
MTITCPWACRYALANIILGLPGGHRPMAHPADPDRFASGVTMRGIGFDPASQTYAAAELVVTFDRPSPVQDPAPS